MAKTIESPNAALSSQITVKTDTSSSPFRKFIPGPPLIPVGDTLRVIKDTEMASVQDIDSMYRQAGILGNTLQRDLGIMQQINYERGHIYREVEAATHHWMVGSAMEVFADYSTQYNSAIHNASVWITSQSRVYSDQLTELLEVLDIEERIYDWAWSTGTYGDLFVRLYGAPGQGIMAIDDNEHPSGVSRVDYMGRLVGFAETPYGSSGQITSQTILPPWDFTHVRLLGAKKRRSMSGDPINMDHRSAYMMSPDTRQLTTRYGTSLVLNALPVYKRLRISEDSLLLARLTRGYQKYLYKLGVKGKNPDAVAMMTQTLMQLVKRGRAWDTSLSGENFASRSNVMNVMEDLFIPIWGEAGDLQVDSIGADPNIKWITDVDALMHQLAASLRVSLSLLGAYVEQNSGALGSDTMEQLDIRFARTARRQQRALKVAIKRICQIHLAYKGYDADPKLFEVHMTESSSAEEQQVKDSLETSIDVASKFMEMMAGTEQKIDWLETIDYLNRKFIKLDDFNLADFIEHPDMGESKVHNIRENLAKSLSEISKANGLGIARGDINERVAEFLNETILSRGFDASKAISTGDHRGPLPYSESCKAPHVKAVVGLNEWVERYQDKQVKVACTTYQEETPAERDRLMVDDQKMTEILKSGY